MSSAAVLLVLMSTITHAYWNFLIKRSGGGSTFIGLSKVVEMVLFAPFFVWSLTRDGFAVMHAWPLLLGGAVLTLGNYVALGKAYDSGDLSVVYPVARGAILLFLPLLGYLVFGERISPVGWVAIVCVMSGIAVIRLPAFDGEAVAAFARRLMDPSIAFALMAALTTAGYTVWDKRAVQRLPAFAYFYGYSVLVALAYAAWLARAHSREVLRAEWRAHGWPIVQVGFLNTTSYLLVLQALRWGTSSYVIALRQLSIGMGVLMGWRLLGEDLALPKRVGVTLLVFGCALAAVAG